MRTESRLHVTSIFSLDPGFCDIILFAESDQVVSGLCKQVWEFIGNQVVIGFSVRGQRRSEFARVVLEGRLGPVIYEVPGPKGRRADVRVVMAESALVSVPGHDTALERKQHAIWHNDRRNNAIACVASALVTGRPDGLWQHGLFLENDEAFAGLGRPPRVAVLVEGLEHGQELVSRLPGWELRSGDIQPADKTRPLHCAVMRLVHAASLRNLDVDALVVADGEGGLLELHAFPPRLRDGVKREIFVVDFHDDGNEAAARATQRRFDEYERRGWTVSRGRTTASVGQSTENKSRARRASK